MAERSSWGIVGLAALCTAPVLAVQVVMAWFSKIFQKHGEAGLLESRLRGGASNVLTAGVLRIHIAGHLCGDWKSLAP